MKFRSTAWRPSFLLCTSLCLTASLGMPAASAHPSFEIKSAAVGAPYKAVIRIPHGCDGSPTMRVRVQIPEGVIGVRPKPMPGWSIETKRGRYDRSYPYYHGATLTEGVREISWSGRLLDEHFDEFVFSGFLADTLQPGSTLYFPIHQECERGSYAWAEIPTAGQNAHGLKSPAPGIALLPVADKKAAPSYKLGSLVIQAPWARATPGGAKVAGGYVKITNTGAEPDRLVGGTLANAGEVEVHEMAMENNVMKMRRLADGLEIKPGATVELKPGGHHLMFMALQGGLKAGQRVKGTLVFQKAGSVELEYTVAPIGAQSGGSGSGGGHHHH
jgi:periplasmic copper chaperone A